MMLCLHIFLLWFDYRIFYCCRKVILWECYVAVLAIIEIENTDWAFINEFLRFFVLPNLPTPLC